MRRLKRIGVPTGIIPTHTINDFLKYKLPEPLKSYLNGPLLYFSFYSFFIPAFIII